MSVSLKKFIIFTKRRKYYISTLLYQEKKILKRYFTQYITLNDLKDRKTPRVENFHFLHLSIPSRHSPARDERKKAKKRENMKKHTHKEKLSVSEKKEG